MDNFFSITFAFMQYIGELISIGVAFSWTATALLSEFGSKRMGNLTLNVSRMAITTRNISAPFSSMICPASVATCITSAKS